MRCLYVRLALFSGLLVVQSSASAQDLDRKISFSQDAARASVLLPALGRAAGVGLSATTRMGDEVLIVNVHDVTLRDLMAKIAQTTQGEWKPLGDGFELSRPSSLQTQVERAELDARAKLIQAKLDFAAGRLAKLPEFTAAEAERMALEEQKANENLVKSFNEGSFESTIRVFGRSAGSGSGTPAERGILAILGTIGAGSLATLGDGQRVVFSSGPTRMQRPFPGRAHDLITRFVKDSLLYSAAKKRKEPDEAAQIQIATAGGGEVGTGNPALGIGRSILTIQRQGTALRVSLIAADPNGASLASGEYTLSLDNASSDGANINNNGPKIPLSPLAAEFAAAVKPVAASTGSFTVGSAIMVMDSDSSSIRLSIGDTGVKQIPISDALRTRLLNPEKNDPQSLTVTEGLNAVAASKKANLVADVSDDAIMPLTLALGAGKTVDAFFKQSCPDAGITFEEKDGWLLAMSKTAVEARSRRLDRSAVGRALRGLDSQTCLRLNQLCAFALAQPKPAQGEDYDGTVMNLINAAGATDALGQLGQADVLRFFGSLSQAQQDGLLAGGTLSLSNLPPTAMAYLSSEVFQSQMGPNRKMPQATGPNFIVPGLTQPLAQERTEYLPNGVPAAGNVHFKVDRQPGALGMDAEGKLAIYGADALASRLYQDEHGNIAPFGNAPKLDKFLPASQTLLSLHFEFPLLAEMDRSLSDTLIDRSNQAVSYDGLPAELKSKIALNLQKMKSTFGNMKFDFLGGAPAKTIPPR